MESSKNTKKEEVKEIDENEEGVTVKVQVKSSVNV